MTTIGNVNLLARLKAFAGLDIHVLATVLFRGRCILAGAVTIILLPLLLSPIEQGFYYTFASVLALQIFFELGLNHVLTQLAGHSAAHLHRAADGSLQGDLRWRRKVVSLFALSNKWNAIMASLFATAILTGGIYFFTQQGTMSVNQWIGPWIILIIAAACNLALGYLRRSHRSRGRKVTTTPVHGRVPNPLGHPAFWARDQLQLLLSDVLAEERHVIR